MTADTGIELVGTVGFRNGPLLPAAKHGDTLCIPRVCGGVVGIKFDRLLELSLPSSKIPFVKFGVGREQHGDGPWQAPAQAL